ncbi:uncharacterized protein SOCE26_038400 [Sorangium cellulosum]|uniref:Uncharacterized protein n=1 Tax=Sorangium cellulosum TaxID=56 RepID=A0A2L0ESZ2_SORCE|nr:hypothetical protein [Sorangium cellulosum]AUX42409.1 uncharacterized protein SOCE26_038400 [Sorangium cellulosum]
MGFYDDIAEAAGTGAITDRDYQSEVDAFMNKLMSAMQVPRDKWGPNAIRSSELVCGQERIAGTQHMVREDGGAWASYWLDVKNFKLEVQVKTWRSSGRPFFFDVNGVLFAPNADFGESCKTAANVLKQQASKLSS